MRRRETEEDLTCSRAEWRLALGRASKFRLSPDDPLRANVSIECLPPNP